MKEIKDIKTKTIKRTVFVLKLTHPESKVFNTKKEAEQKLKIIREGK